MWHLKKESCVKQGWNNIVIWQTINIMRVIKRSNNFQLRHAKRSLYTSYTVQCVTMVVTLHCLTEKSISTASWKWTFTSLCLCCGVLAGSILLLCLGRWIQHSIFFLLWSQEVMDSFLNVWPENMVQLGIHHLSYNSVHTRLQHSRPIRIVENFLQLILHLWFQLKSATPVPLGSAIVLFYVMSVCIAWLVQVKNSYFVHLLI